MGQPLENYRVLLPVYPECHIVALHSQLAAVERYRETMVSVDYRHTMVSAGYHYCMDNGGVGGLPPYDAIVGSYCDGLPRGPVTL